MAKRNCHLQAGLLQNINSNLMRGAYIYIMYMLVALFLPSCDKDHSGDDSVIPPGEGELAVDYQIEGTDIPPHDAHLLVFGANDKLATHEYFDDPAAIELHTATLLPGRYTVVMVMNVGKDFLTTLTRAGEDALPDISLSEFIRRLEEATLQYPDLLTGLAQTEVNEGVVNNLSITIKAGTGGIALPVLHLVVTLPEQQLPDYPSTRTQPGYALRCIAEVRRAGNNDVICRMETLPALDGDKRFSLDLRLKEDNYDLTIWTESVQINASGGIYYDSTQGLNAISIVTDPYRANTDRKDAAYASPTAINLPEEGRTVDISLQRPLAKYRIIATDIADYRRLIKTSAYPPLEELTIKIVYEGFFPSGFNAATGKPNNAVGGNTIYHAASAPCIKRR